MLYFLGIIILECMMGEDTGEPFLFARYFEDYVIYVKNENSHTVSTIPAEYKTQIKGEYIPESVKPLLVSFTIDWNTNEVTANVTAEQIHNAFMSGRVIMGAVFDNGFVMKFDLSNVSTYADDGGEHFEAGFNSYGWFTNDDGSYGVAYNSIYIFEGDKGEYTTTGDCKLTPIE